MMLEDIVELSLIVPTLIAFHAFGISAQRNASIDLRVHHIERVPENAATSNATHTYIRPCYFTSWSQYRPERAKYTPEHYIPGLCTHILYAFAWMNNDFTIRAFDEADLPGDWSGIGMYARVNRLKSVDSQLRTLLSVGGWSFGTQLFQQMSQNKTGRSKFISSAIKFIREHDFDGIDIDWEYPKGPDDILKYSLFIKELREAINGESSSSRRNRLLLTAAVSAGEATIQRAYDIPELAKHVDFVLLMSYDFHGAWEAETGVHNALYMRHNENGRQKAWNTDWAANHWMKKGMPREKIIIGIATYGRGWTLTNAETSRIGSPGTAANATKFTGESGVAAYYELCEMIASGAERHWEPESQVPYLIHGDQWFSYDDPESIKNKMAWLKRQHFGGAFVWTLDFDDFNGRCSSGNGIVYPLVGTIAHELAGIDIMPLVNATTLQPLTTIDFSEKTSSKTDWQTSTPTDEDVCQQLTDGFHPLSTSYAKFLLCVKGKSFIFDCPEGLKFHRRLLYCADDEVKDQKHPVTAGLNTSTVMTTASSTKETSRWLFKHRSDNIHLRTLLTL